MNGMGYQDWAKRAFLNVESLLSSELCGFNNFVAEENVRTAFVKGLILSRPDAAPRVGTEEDAAWSTNPCANSHGQQIVAAGRKLQHDVAIYPDPSDPTDAGFRCEVKWLKGAKAIDVCSDIWKLALSRGTSPDGAAMRTYLLIGGTPKGFSDTLSTLGKNDLPLAWRAYGGSVPSPRKLRLERIAHHGPGSATHKGLLQLLSFGDKKKPHCRTPPDCWNAIRATVRAAWTPTLPGVSHWRAVLWELHTHGIGTKVKPMNWQPWLSSLGLNC